MSLRAIPPSNHPLLVISRVFQAILLRFDHRRTRRAYCKTNCVFHFSTWKSPASQQTTDAVSHAISVGYRHIGTHLSFSFFALRLKALFRVFSDCAARYNNEREVGVGIKKALADAATAGVALKREDLFITSKLWNTEHHPDHVRLALEQTLHDLGVGYLDMYLIHWPVAELKPREGPVMAGDPAAEDVALWETFEAMNLLKEEGLVKAIGVSNFSVTQISDLINDCDLIPDVNQVELHPYLTQKKLSAFCDSKGIAVTAYSPLGMNEAPKSSGNLPKLTENLRILDLATKYGKTASQILVRWSTQLGNVVIPKSLNPLHIEENLDIFSFELTKEEVDVISALNANHRFVKPAFYDFSD